MNFLYMSSRRLQPCRCNPGVVAVSIFVEKKKKKEKEEMARECL
nr:MAG TPA: hypothetical protein [Caudoviricetes sp.]